MENPIKMFFHCKHCVLEKPHGVSPNEFQDMAAGIDRDRNVIIWCNRHEEIITRIKPVRSDISQN